MNYDYYQWLIGLLDDDYLAESYQKLTADMFETEFVWTVAYDGNRAADGLNMRSIYSRESGRPVYMDTDCNVLEMFIALCRRCDEELMYDPDDQRGAGYWFWVILENMGLDIYDDYSYDRDAVDTILERFLTRDYEKNGFGGPFYVCNSMCDFRDKDLWWQLNVFLEENFTF